MLFDPERTIQLLVRWLVLAITVWVAAGIVGGIYLQGFGNTLAVALILGLLNLYVRPLFRLLTFPLTLITLGLFLVVGNAIMLGLTSWIAGGLGVRFHVDGFGAALLGALVISVVGLLLGLLIKPDRIARDLTR